MDKSGLIEYTNKVLSELPKKLTQKINKDKKFYPNAELPKERDRSQRSSCLRIGAFLVIRKIIEDYGLDEMLARIIGSDSDLFMDLATYSVISENNAGQYYPDYAYNHPLFTSDMRIYSDSKVSDFFGNLSIDQSIAFLNEWNASRDHREKIDISKGRIYS